jgi:hypothetical protein
MQNNLYNGRVNLYASGTARDCLNTVPINSTSGSDVLSMEHTPVSALFFSKKNVDALQLGICNMVFNQSDGKYNIGPQSETDLKIIMRSIYLTSLQGTSPIDEDGSVIGKVRTLNQKVLDWSVPRIITNIKQFDRYKSDVSKIPIPMDRPAQVSSAGSKILEFQSFF